MSTRSPQSQSSKLRSAIYAFLFLGVLAVGFFGAGLALGTEPRMVMERTGDRLFRVTNSNQFSGYQFFTKTVDGVSNVIQDDAVRDRRSDSAKERRKRKKQKHLELKGTNGMLSWDRESDQILIQDFMRGTEPILTLADKPPLWRNAVAWFLMVFSGLVFIAAVQSFFPKKSGLP